VTVYRDAMDVETGVTDWQGDLTWTTVHDNAPCDVSPIDSKEGSVEGTIITRYLVATPVDVGAIFADPGVEQVRITYRGKVLALSAGIETHRALARFHHAEFIVEDFGA
jgi:hypothetical protein